MVTSAAHTRFAISSRRKTTSSTGADCCERPTAGARKRRRSSRLCSPRGVSVHIAQFPCNPSWLCRLAVGSTSVLNPKLSRTTMRFASTSVPTLAASGRMNQSFENTSPNSARSSLMRSVLAAVTSPKPTRRSSNSHQRIFGMPGNSARVGKNESTRRTGAASIGFSSSPVPCATSNEYQSR